MSRSVYDKNNKLTKRIKCLYLDKKGTSFRLLNALRLKTLQNEKSWCTKLKNAETLNLNKIFKKLLIN